MQHPEKYSAFFGTLFVFIAAMNLIGIIPIFESPTMEVAVPVGLAVSTWVYYHVMGVRELGPGKYLKHFLGPVLWLAPLMIFIEIIGHFARMLSLTVRLYGNMFAGEQIHHRLYRPDLSGGPGDFHGPARLCRVPAGLRFFFAHDDLREYGNCARALNFS